MVDNSIGKQAEAKLKQWLDRPAEGYCLDRLKDQMTGFYGSRNICDFTLFKSPNFYYIESKATWEDRFSFDTISGFRTPNDITCQYGGLLYKANIPYVYGVIAVLFVAHQRAFLLDICEIHKTATAGQKSLNIKKLSTWPCRYREIQTIPSRKKLLDYTGGFDLWPV